MLHSQATDGLTQTIQTFGFALISFHLGRTLSTHLPFPTLPHLSRPSILFFALLGPLLYLATLFTLIFTPPTFHPGRRITFTLLLSPPGSILRWWLSSLNPTFPACPTLGTFLANILATALLSTTYLLQRALPVGSTSLIQCQALQSIEDGLCGCLSTVSTFVVELDALADKGEGTRWMYAGGSYLAGIAVVVLIFGVGWWALPGGLHQVCTY